MRCIGSNPLFLERPLTSPATDVPITEALFILLEDVKLD